MFAPPSLPNLVKTMLENGNRSHMLNFGQLASGQTWTTEEAIRAEFTKQEEALSLQPAPVIEDE